MTTELPRRRPLTKAIKGRALGAILLSIVGSLALACDPPDPQATFPEADLYYATFNSVRMIDVDGDEHTLSNQNHDFFGLERSGNTLITADNSLSFLSVIPIFQNLASNKAWDSCSGSSLCNQATDIALLSAGGSTDAVACADEAVILVRSPLSSQFVSTDPRVRLIDDTVVNLPFSVSVTRPFVDDIAIVVGVDQMSVTHIDESDPTNTMFRTIPVTGHGLVMGGFSTVDAGGNLYVADPGADVIRKFGSGEVIKMATAVTGSSSSINVSSDVLSSGGLLADGSNDAIRGPIGIDFREGQLWVTVDVGTNQPGHIINVDPVSGAQSMWRTNIPGPRDIVMN